MGDRARSTLIWVGIILMLMAFGLGTLVLSYFFAVWFERMSGSVWIGQAMGVLLFISLGTAMGIAFGIIRFLVKASKDKEKAPPPVQ